MLILIHTDIGKAKSQLETLTGFRNNLSSGGMYFRFLDVVDIDGDFASPEFREREQVIRDLWNEKKDAIVMAIEIILEANEIFDDNDIHCYLTTLGPYGYYNPPNEIFVNIWDAPSGHTLATIVHEALHLALVPKTSGMSYEETEKFIDGQFKIPELANIFPDYEAQVFQC